MSSAIVWTKTEDKEDHSTYEADFNNAQVRIYEKKNAGDGLLIPPSTRWSFDLRSKYFGFSISGHRGHGQTRKDAEDSAVAYIGLRSVAKVLGMKQVVSDDGWDLVWVADAEL